METIRQEADFTINIPIFNPPGVGLSVRRLTTFLNSGIERVTVDIVYKLKDGSLMYPDRYTVALDAIRNCRRQTCGGTTLVIVPIDLMYVRPEHQHAVVP